MSGADMRRQRWVREVVVYKDNPFWALTFCGYFLMGLWAASAQEDRIHELEAKVQRLTPPPVTPDRTWYPAGHGLSHGTTTTPALTTGGACQANTIPALGDAFMRAHVITQAARRAHVRRAGSHGE